MPNIIGKITGDLLKEEYKLQWYDYYKLISSETIGKQIYDAFMGDKEYCDTYVNLLKP